MNNFDQALLYSASATMLLITPHLHHSSKKAEPSLYDKPKAVGWPKFQDHGQGWMGGGGGGGGGGVFILGKRIFLLVFVAVIFVCFSPTSPQCCDKPIRNKLAFPTWRSPCQTKAKGSHPWIWDFSMEGNQNRNRACESCTPVKTREIVNGVTGVTPHFKNWQNTGGSDGNKANQPSPVSVSGFCFAWQNFSCFYFRSVLKRTTAA